MSATGSAGALPEPVLSAAAQRCRSGGAILDAALELLAERGIEGLTVDGVAARAKVGKATIYRHWRSRAELLMDAMASLPVPAAPAPTGDLRADLCAVLGGLARVLRDPRRSRLLSALVDGAERDPELARLHAAHSATRRAPAVALLADALARGELPPGTDLELAADLLGGPLLYRRLLAHEPVPQAYVAAVVDAVLTAVSWTGPRVDARS